MVSFHLPHLRFPKRKSSSHSTLSTSLPNSSSRYLASQDEHVYASPPNFFQRLLPSASSRVYFAVLLIETLANVSLEAYFLSQTNWHNVLGDVGNENADEDEKEQLRNTLPVYLGLFVFAHIFQLILALDALHAKNTIQVIGLVAFNASFLMYSIIQISELRQYNITESNVPDIIPILIFVAEIFYAIAAWYIYKDFGWQVYKKIGADLRMKKIYAWWEIFICVLKFDFFFWVAFCVQLVLLVLPGRHEDIEYYVTLVAPVFLFLLLLVGYLSARKEWKIPMYGFMFGNLGALGYFGFKIFRIISRRTTEYKVTWKSMIVFAALSFMTSIATLITAIICTRNFGMGLTHYIDVPRASKEEDDRPIRQTQVPLYDPHPADFDGRDGKYDSYVAAADAALDGKSSGGLRRHDTRMSID